jgi:hypothetical protein
MPSWFHMLNVLPCRIEGRVNFRNDLRWQFCWFNILFCSVGSAKKNWWLGIDMSIYSICSYLFNTLKSWGGYISKMTQDAKLGHMLNVAVCTGQGEGEKIITLTQNANYHVGSRNCEFRNWLRKPLLWFVRGIVFQGKERSSKYKGYVTFLLCSYIHPIGLQR